MSDFGIAGEGVTDNVTLENIILGVYHDVEELEEDDEIIYLQPLLDATDKDRHGGWYAVLIYLQSKRFRDDVVNNNHLVIQIDTDVAGEPGFDLQLTDGNDKDLPVEDIVKIVKARLIAQIELGKEGFYEQHVANIMFAISVHSLECWLFSLHNKLQQDNGTIKNCESKLISVLQKEKKDLTFKEQEKGKGKRKDSPQFIEREKGEWKMKKNYNVYNHLSAPFCKKKGKNIEAVCKVDTSFRLFIEDLKNIDYPE